MRKKIKSCVSTGCTREATRNWRGKPVCHTCHQRAWSGGSVEGPWVIVQERRSARRERAFALLDKGWSKSRIARKLRVDMRTITRDLQSADA